MTRSAQRTRRAPAHADRPTTPRQIVATDGSRSVIELSGENEVISVRDRTGGLLFEYRPDENKSVVYAPHGDLSFAAPNGSIEFAARDTVQIHGGHRLDMTADHRVRVGTTGAKGAAPSMITMQPRGLDVSTQAVDARAAQVELNASEVRLVARTLTTALETAHHVVGTLEVQATRLLERVTNVFREAAQLSQTTAARLRLIAEGTLEALGGETLIEADRDVKIKGDKIHLG